MEANTHITVWKRSEIWTCHTFNRAGCWIFTDVVHVLRQQIQHWNKHQKNTSFISKYFHASNWPQMCAGQHLIFMQFLDLFTSKTEVNRAGPPFFSVSKIIPWCPIWTWTLHSEMTEIQGHASCSYCSPYPQASAFQSKVQEHSGTLQV